MKTYFLTLLFATASASSQADDYSSIPSLQGILCQMHLGDIPLCAASSCKEIADTRLETSRSGLHWLKSGNTVFKAYCSNQVPVDQSQGWMRVASVTSDSGCPAGLEQLTAGGRKLCRKTVGYGCSSVTFASNGVSYSKVCGLVYGYMKDSSDGFRRYYICSNDCTIDQPYVDGVSITHGSPRQHIWTLGAAWTPNFCPCGVCQFHSHVFPFVRWR